ncbi:MAG TPA: FAD-dependent monooxygenase [Actinopolymorphaceae bacterium]|jgi:2-polyprenyl-6-methoxyphenol hydroxylase-like FAD-dependent oxidoreductase
MAGAAWHTPALVESMRTAPGFSFSEIAQVHLESWSRGRVVLVGDAGYCPSPLTGLGTSLGLAGAYVLAGELAAAADGDIRAALDRCERVLRPYVKQAQELPPGGVNGYAPRSKVGIRLGWWSIRMMSRWPMRPLRERQFGKADAIDLPEYQFANATSLCA